MRRVIIILLFFILTILFGCKQNTNEVNHNPKLKENINKSASVKDKKRILLDEAKKLTGENLLEEVTTPEIWDKLKIQTFISDKYAYLIDNRKVVKFYYINGDYLITDLNSDSNPELLYIRQIGSGILNTYIMVYTKGKFADLAFNSLHSKWIVFDRVTEKNIQFTSEDHIKGNLVILEEGTKLSLGLLYNGVVYFEGIPDYINVNVKQQADSNLNLN